MSYGALYTGYRLPNGMLPPSIMQNGKQARDIENEMLNNGTYLMWLTKLLSISISLFEWSNLPEGIDTRMMELWLTQNGFGVFFKDEALKENTDNMAPDGYAFLQAMIGGQWNMYNLPIDRRAYSVNGYNIQLDMENSVLVFDNELRILIFPTIDLYARRLAEIDRTIDVNIRAQKTPKIITCTDKQRLSFENMVKMIDGNVYNIFADKSLDRNAIDVLDTTAPYVGDQLMSLKRQYLNEVLTYLGVENVTTEKKERLITNEVMSNMGDVEAMRFTRLNARKRACEQINNTFGLNVDCNFRSGIYIKADGYGSDDIATSGMQDANELTRGEDLPTNKTGSGILAKIRALLGA